MRDPNKPARTPKATKTPKGAIETAVNRASKSLLGIIKVYERHGASIEDTFTVRSFAHLQNILHVTHQRSLAAKLSGAGVFSLDAPIAPSVPAFTPPPVIVAAPQIVPQTDEQLAKLVPIAQPVITETPATPPKKWIKPEGRLARTNPEDPPGSLVFPTAPVKSTPAPIDPSEVPDKTGAIKTAGFLDA